MMMFIKATLSSQGLVQLIGELLNQRPHQNPAITTQLMMRRIVPMPCMGNGPAMPSAQALPLELAHVMAMSQRVIGEVNRLHALGTALPAALYQQYILPGIDRQLADFMKDCEQSLSSTVAAEGAPSPGWMEVVQDADHIGPGELYVMAAQFMTAAKTALAPSLKTRYVQVSAALTALANAHLH
jgi:hypothetical protein